MTNKTPQGWLKYLASKGKVSAGDVLEAWQDVADTNRAELHRENRQQFEKLKEETDKWYSRRSK